MISSFFDGDLRGVLFDFGLADRFQAAGLVDHDPLRADLVDREERNDVSPVRTGDDDFIRAGHAKLDFAGRDLLPGRCAGAAGLDVDVKVVLGERAALAGGVDAAELWFGDPVQRDGNFLSAQGH